MVNDGEQYCWFVVKGSRGVQDEQSRMGCEEQAACALVVSALPSSTVGARERVRRATAKELISMVAHDLRSYLTPLDGYIALLRANAEREGRVRDAQHAAAASAASAELVRMTSRLLTARRLDRGLLVPDMELLDLAALIRAAASAVAGPEALIRVEGPERLPGVGDPALLREVLANLLTNALRHSPPDAPIIVHVAVAWEDGKETHAIVRVSDRGPGVAPDLLPHIFEQFTADAGSTGLGLGLYLAREIAHAHGGALTAESTAGRGATFRLVLPLALPRERAVREPDDTTEDGVTDRRGMNEQVRG